MNYLKSFEKLTMSSREIADLCNKRHDNVKRKIENFAGQNIISCPQIEDGIRSKNGVTEKIYRIGKRDSLIIVAQLFPKFLAAVIDRWQELEKQLLQQTINQQNAEWQQARLTGKGIRKEFTDAIQELEEYARKQGSQNYGRYYGNYSKMINKLLFNVSSVDRDILTMIQLTHLKTAEDIAGKAIYAGIEQGMYYKDIFQLAKKEVEKLVAIIGVSEPGVTRKKLR